MTAPHRAVVTGAAGVIGRWIVRAFAAEGAEVLLVDAREDPLIAARDEEAPGQHIIAADLATGDGRRAVAEAVRELWGSATVLVNNAGVYPHDDMLDVSDEEMRRIFAINVDAPFSLTRDLAAQMIEAGHTGSVVNISSGAAVNPASGGGPYAASKAALEMFTRAFALELAPHGIRVNTVQPGFAPGSEVSALDDDYIARMSATIPLGRVSGPEDAPSAILFLASEKASFITGSTIATDGGRTAGTFRSAARPGPRK